MPDENLLLDFMRSELARGMHGTGLSPTDNLIDAGILDSLGILKLILFLEEKFSVKIQDEDLVPDHFESIRSIHSLVRKKMTEVSVTA